MGWNDAVGAMERCANGVLLVLPFFLWGTNMVVMEEVMPKTGAMFVAVARLIPAGALIVVFASLGGKKFPSGARAWSSIALFGLINGALFQVCLVEGLSRTTAGIGSVIIDSQPLTVAVLAAVLYGELLGPKSIIALAFGILGIFLIEVPVAELQSLLHPASATNTPPLNSNEKWSIWDSGEWWMLLAAQSMAIGTIMMRWVSKFSDSLMVIGWHMVLGGVPVLALSIWKQDPGVTGHLKDLDLVDWACLFYVSVFGSAIAFGLFFYSATRGSLTELSSLTLLTPVFATIFGYLLRNETFTGLKLVGAFITLVSICFVKVEKPKEIEGQELNKTKYEALPVDTIP
ncbi:hypothetical protein KC19_8G019000 [Ceratodon purpureus]|uniref:EamA domain-containing protein n=1 Tax=Ceratodon purpureus TaxID=3225 RepID=A0A8T0GYH3_CERPU|nr:hypothetical protein KC19_8G019000 [Ceratodon purpureus]